MRVTVCYFRKDSARRKHDKGAFDSWRVYNIYTYRAVIAAVSRLVNYSVQSLRLMHSTHIMHLSVQSWTMQQGHKTLCCSVYILNFIAQLRNSSPAAHYIYGA